MAHKNDELHYGIKRTPFVSGHSVVVLVKWTPFCWSQGSPFVGNLTCIHCFVVVFSLLLTFISASTLAGVGGGWGLVCKPRENAQKPTLCWLRYHVGLFKNSSIMLWLARTSSNSNMASSNSAWNNKQKTKPMSKCNDFWQLGERRA